MSIIGNIIWFILGGIWMGLSWWFFGLLCFISIIGIPRGKACFVLGQFAFLPFGRMAISRQVLEQFLIKNCYGGRDKAGARAGMSLKTTSKFNRRLETDKDYQAIFCLTF